MKIKTPISYFIKLSKSIGLKRNKTLKYSKQTFHNTIPGNPCLSEESIKQAILNSGPKKGERIKI